MSRFAPTAIRCIPASRRSSTPQAVSSASSDGTASKRNPLPRPLYPLRLRRGSEPAFADRSRWSRSRLRSGTLASSPPRMASRREDRPPAFVLRPLGKLCTRSRPSRMARGRGKWREVSKLAFASAHGSQDFETPRHLPKDSPAALYFGSGETLCRASLARATNFCRLLPTRVVLCSAPTMEGSA
jgi:hypothetical protein